MLSCPYPLIARGIRPQFHYLPVTLCDFGAQLFDGSRRFGCGCFDTRLVRNLTHFVKFTQLRNQRPVQRQQIRVGHRASIVTCEPSLLAAHQLQRIGNHRRRQLVQAHAETLH